MFLQQQQLQQQLQVPSAKELKETLARTLFNDSEIAVGALRMEDGWIRDETFINVKNAVLEWNQIDQSDDKDKIEIDGRNVTITTDDREESEFINGLEVHAVIENSVGSIDLGNERNDEVQLSGFVGTVDFNGEGDYSADQITISNGTFIDVKNFGHEDGGSAHCCEAIKFHPSGTINKLALNNNIYIFSISPEGNLTAAFRAPSEDFVDRTILDQNNNKTKVKDIPFYNQDSEKVASIVNLIDSIIETQNLNLAKTVLNQPLETSLKSIAPNAKGVEEGNSRQ